VAYNLVWVVSSSPREICDRLAAGTPTWDIVQSGGCVLIVRLPTGRRIELRFHGLKEFSDNIGISMSSQDVPELVLIDLAVDEPTECVEEVRRWRDTFASLFGWKALYRAQ